MFWLFRLLNITTDISGLLKVISACKDLGLHAMVAPLGGGLIDSMGVCGHQPLFYFSNFLVYLTFPE